MINYNDSSIIAGYIKQALSSFNLPTINVLNEADGHVWAIDGKYYIYKNNVVRSNATTQSYDNSTFTEISKYIWNDKIDITTNLEYNLKALNFTNHLAVRNTYYDSYTHKYLGNYLRFLRDYKHVDLMPLYNCYSGEVANNLEIKLENIDFNSKDMNYKIYVIPVRFYHEYTIAIDSSTPFEILCGIYGTNNVSGEFLNELYLSSYEKIRSASFSKKVVYSKLVDFLETDIYNKTKFLDFENDLCMFIKIPATNNSTIAILEGNYLVNNDFTFNDDTIRYAYSIINYGDNGSGKINDEKIDYNKINKITKLQLLDINSGVSHPFSDKLIGYLVGNFINSQETISDNIKRVQERLINNYEINKDPLSLSDEKIYFDNTYSERDIFNAFYPTINGKNHSYPGMIIYDKYGIWEDRYKCILYDLAIRNNGANKYYELLGSVDKDVEKILGPDVDIYGISGSKRG